MQFNETLALLRKSRGFTQEKLAERLGVSRQAVARWEAGETAPDVYILSDLSEIFGISADGLLNGVDEASLSAPADHSPKPAEISEKSAASLPLRTKLKFATIVMAIIAVTVTANIGIIKLSDMRSQKAENVYSQTGTDTPRLTSLSNAPETEFWTADEYEKWAEEQLEIYREKYKNGEEILWHTEEGDVYRALTKEDIKKIEDYFDETLAAIKNGDLITKDEIIFWTDESGKTYFAAYDDVFVTDATGETAIIENDDSFLTFDDAAIPFETVFGETVAQGNAENKVQTFEEIFAKYEKYGLKYYESDGERMLYYNGEAVGRFIDEDPYGGIFIFTPDGAGTLTVRAEYDLNGKLSGVSPSE